MTPAAGGAAVVVMIYNVVINASFDFRLIVVLILSVYQTHTQKKKI